MKKILVWYLDINGETRIQVLDKPDGYLVQTFLYEFSRNGGVKSVLEAYTISEIHAIHEYAPPNEGFYTATTIL